MKLSQFFSVPLQPLPAQLPSLLSSPHVTFETALLTRPALVSRSSGPAEGVILIKLSESLTPELHNSTWALMARRDKTRRGEERLRGMWLGDAKRESSSSVDVSLAGFWSAARKCWSGDLYFVVLVDASRVFTHRISSLAKCDDDSSASPTFFYLSAIKRPMARLSHTLPAAWSPGRRHTSCEVVMSAQRSRRIKKMVYTEAT
ncbi:hypothetical protein E2C01_026164 [Portunus trituberculatus]|uniref:Uncharacterized protein n=1 Tax=Portunus trituberculatus TaxID=210409 RepID=A0A5B7EIF0_PORTR|nr:hypothetical protein [Portunus trituberculatus]